MKKTGKTRIAMKRTRWVFPAVATAVAALIHPVLGAAVLLGFLLFNAPVYKRTAGSKELETSGVISVAPDTRTAAGMLPAPCKAEVARSWVLLF